MLQSANNDVSAQEPELLELDGFVSDDGLHQVSWELVEVAPNLEYEMWWCKTHDRMYYGGCFSKEDQND